MKNTLFIFLTILTISCNREESINPTDKTSLNLVTGINSRQTSDDIILKLGNPNVLVNDKFVIYPNPAIESFYILAQEKVTDVWLVPANPEKIYQNINFNSILNTNLYSEQSIISHSNLALNGQSSSAFNVNIGNLTKGYYKVFVKIGGIIYWDILYKYNSQEDNEIQFNSISNFWD